ncbi:MAG: SDR family oxidoreductase [Chloroflexota bacterium]|nr:MAG: SDR family oxidoreductase [Chloroflexota bacterium]
MAEQGSVVVVGGTRAIGFEIVRHYASAGDDVILTGQTAANVAAAVERAADLPGKVTGLTFDLADPVTIRAALEGVGPVRRLALVAIDRDSNTVADYDVTRAIRLATLKLVGFTEVVHVLLDRLTPNASLLLFGGQAKDLPYPGSTTVSTVNGGVEGIVRTLVHEIKPHRVNCLHPGIVGDSPYWESRQAALEATIKRTPTGRLTTMAEIVDAAVFLLENEGMNGVNLKVDGGLHCM